MKLSEKIYVRTIALLVILIIAMLVVAVALAVAGECDKNATKRSLTSAGLLACTSGTSTDWKGYTSPPNCTSEIARGRRP